MDQKPTDQRGLASSWADAQARLLDPFPMPDLEWRVQTAGVTKDGRYWALIVPYLTNRAIQERLDAVFGFENWRNSFRHVDATAQEGMICRLEVRLPGTTEWIAKEDGAPLTHIEPFKGGASDSMKRAGYELGIGRYLYHLPEFFAQVHPPKCDCGGTNRKGRPICTAVFKGELPKKAADAKQLTQEQRVFRYDPPLDFPDWALPQNGRDLDQQKELQRRAQADATDTSEPEDPALAARIAEERANLARRWDALMSAHNVDAEARIALAYMHPQLPSTEAEWGAEHFQFALQLMQTKGPKEVFGRAVAAYNEAAVSGKEGR